MREFDDLTFVDHLRPLDGPLTSGGDYSCVLVEDIDASQTVARDARFDECAIRGTHLTSADLTGSRSAHSWFRNVDLTGARLNEIDWQDDELIECVMAGAEAVGAQLRRVTFEGCKLDGVNFSGATLTDVTFRDCMLRDVELGGATLTRVAFPGTHLELALTEAVCDRVDLREAAQLTITEGVSGLRGAMITQLQLLDLAPTLAASIGIDVRN